MKINFGLRVKNRTQKDITLLWDKEGLTESQINNVKIFHGAKPIKFLTDSAIDTFKGKTFCCLIPHETNDMKHDQEYNLRISLGGSDEEPIEQSIKVLPYGKLPDYEKDKQHSRVHMMGCDIDTGQWTRVPLKRLANGTYAIPVVIVRED